jgi:putative hydrolase of the HAD superfamily
MHIETIFFDLDDTLYPRESGVWPAILERMEQYMRAEVGIPAEQVRPLRERFRGQYGTTLRGLHHEYQIDPEDYLGYVHEIPVEALLKPNPALAAMLERLPQRKWIFTNSSVAHSRRVLAALGMNGSIEGIIDTTAMNYQSKPAVEVYQLALELAGGKPAANCLYLDDLPRNLEPAHAQGIGTVLVGSREAHPAADFSILAADELLQALPWLVE